MLYLIGLGLGDENDVSPKSIEVARNCDCFAELYTNKWFGSLDGLSRIIGKPVNLLKRIDLEDRVKTFLSRAKEKDVALFVPGDPLAATTHSMVVLEARKMKIPVRVIHNASIFSAIGETGLQLYKFGKTATIPLTGKLQAVKDAIKHNRKSGLHTLLLLDLDAEVNLFMKVDVALKMLVKEKILKNSDYVVAVARIGTEKTDIRYGLVRKLQNEEMDTPAAIVVPGKLHFQEREFLESLWKL